MRGVQVRVREFIERIRSASFRIPGCHLEVDSVNISSGRVSCNDCGWRSEMVMLYTHSAFLESVAHRHRMVAHR